MIDLPIYLSHERVPPPKHFGDLVLREVAPPSYSGHGWVVQEAREDDRGGNLTLTWCVIGLGCSHDDAIRAAGLVPVPKGLRKAPAPPLDAA